MATLAGSSRMRGILLIATFAMAAMARAQSALPVPSAFPLDPASAMNLSRTADPQSPFSVIGPRGAILGQQNGSFEAWLFPWKILSGMHLSVDMQDYAVPIDVNQLAAAIEVRPSETILTYSHANFTIRQIMLAPKSPQGNSGALVLYQFEAIRPMTITFSFTPVMQLMWPAQSDDRPSPEWVATGTSGYYILHLNFPDHAAALAMPHADSGILPPYQERASSWPLQFVVHFDPKRDAGRLYPLLMTVANSAQDTTKTAFEQSLAQLDSQIAAVFRANRDYYRAFLGHHTAIETPDPDLNAAFSWAETAIDQLRVQTAPDQQALTAGFVGSGDAARPGFGWFFGRDSLWSLYAIDSYGGFDAARQELQFLALHQRADGKIMHERSQTAGLVDWSALPYEWAAADSTPLFAMAANDYLRISGDRAFVTSLWPNLERAWSFETSHDTDGDGIYDNSQGSGWVESWIPEMPHQEIYLAALDEQASLAFANLARATGHDDLATAAQQRADRIAKTIETEYYLPDSQDYAFSWNGNGQRDATSTIFPSVAWWDGNTTLAHPEPMLQNWASSDISTDWGTRDLSDRTSFYDPISYHQGSVWPLFTGWVSLAEYRAGHPLSAYVHLMQNANLTWAQDPGDVTELLSGRFYQVLGRSTAHQLWSSAMVISPTLRGLFGLAWDVPNHTLTVTPSLPAVWNQATIRRLPFGEKFIDVSIRRNGQRLLVRSSDPTVRLASAVPGTALKNGELSIPLPAVEAAITEALPDAGAETDQLKVLADEYQGRSLVFRLSAPGGTAQTLSVRENVPQPALATHDADLGAATDGVRTLTVQFPEGAGYTEKTVTLTW
jgi:glycogen debranching enzyme